MPTVSWKDYKLKVLFDDFCAEKGCDSYIEWDLDDDPDSQPYDCTSCTMVGQSFNIEEYPPECPYLEEIKKFEVEERDRLEKEYIWEKMNGTA